jgi:hypothetical protein
MICDGMCGLLAQNGSVQLLGKSQFTRKLQVHGLAARIIERRLL